MKTINTQRKIILLLVLVLVQSFLFAQSTFTSMEQARYKKGESLEYISSSKYLIEVSFHTQEGYIDLLNKDSGYKNHFTNVMAAEKPNTWRGFSKDTGKVYVFSFLTVKGVMCIVMDDGKTVDFLKLKGAKTNRRGV